MLFRSSPSVYFYDSNSGHLQPYKYTLGLGRAVARAGVRIFENSWVTRLEIAERADADNLVHTASGTVRARHLVAATGGHNTPAHNHTTWAVIVGVTGEELNRFYDRDGEGVREKGQYVVKQGTGVCFLPEDLHSIHIEAPLVNFHMYGLGLDQLHSREYYKPEDKAWKVFPAHGDIREAR